MCRVRQIESATAFLESAEPFLLAKEAEYNLLLGVTTSLSEQEETGRVPVMNCPISPAALLMTVESGGETVACAVRTPPYRLIITHGSDKALSALADHLAEFDSELPGVIGPAASGSVFARRWSEVTGAETATGRSMRILRLDRVDWPAEPPPGAFRAAEPGDTAELERWIYSFGDEIGEEQDGRTLARSRIAEGSLFIWEQEGLRSMAAAARRTPNGRSVNLVYTPKAYRGRGYASACVAALSDRILKCGFTHCSLYTDASNPTSNHIYEQIGYRQIGESREVAFRCRK